MKTEESETQAQYERPMSDAQGTAHGTNFLIRFDRVTKTYKDSSVALQGIDLSIADGEFISIVGPSGAGKSTLMKLIYAEEMPTEGEVWFNGRAISEISRGKLPLHRRYIGTVFQDSKLLNRKTVFENVAYALEVLGVPSEEIEEDVPQILEIVGMGHMMEKFPEQLSGGEKQKVAMARALIHKPIVIIADEPTGNLDPVSSLEIVDLLLKINELGTTVVLASHDKDIVNKAQKRVLVMDQGKIINDYSKGKYKLI